MKNIVSYELNDECCGVVDDKGRIRILKKKNSNSSFNEYLEIENEIDNLISKKKNFFKKSKSIEQRGCLLLISLIISIIFMFNAQFALIEAIIAECCYLTICGLLVCNIFDWFNNQKKVKQINQEIKTAKKEINEFKKLMSLLNENVYIHEPDLRYELRNSEIEDIIIESIKSLQMFFHLNYGDELDNVTMNYFENDLISFEQCEKSFISHPTSVNYKFNDDLKKNKQIYEQKLSDLLIYRNKEQKCIEEQKISNSDEIPQNKFVLPKGSEKENNLVDFLIYDNEEEKQKELKLKIKK